MSTKTHKPSAAIAQDARELYDALMWDIEPELTTLVLPYLDEMYSEETAEERHERGKWYGEAFEEFFERYGKFAEDCKQYLHKVKRQFRHLQEKETDKSESKQLSSLEDSIQES